MPDTTTTVQPPETTEAIPARPAPPTPEQLELKRRYPTALDLRKAARKRLPNFSFEYADGGAGADGGIDRNWSALDAVEMVPRYGLVDTPPPVSCELFGRAYSAPFGISPVGGPGTVFPGAETYFAKAAQAARIPYTLGMLSSLSIEQAPELAPDVIWLQLYRFARNDHKIGLDLVRRSQAAGIRVLVLTCDTPVRTVPGNQKRHRESVPANEQASDGCPVVAPLADVDDP